MLPIASVPNCFDVIYGGADNDQIRGRGLDSPADADDADSDFTDGGLGNDEILGDDGDDTLLGGDGADRIRGDNGLSATRDGNDTIVGGDDIVMGGDGADRINGDHAHIEGGRHGKGVLSGGAGNDKLYGYGGDDALLGDEGDDLLVGDTSEAFLSLGRQRARRQLRPDKCLRPFLVRRIFPTSRRGVYRQTASAVPCRLI